MKCTLLRDGARVPVQATSGSAGFDLYYPEAKSFTIEAGSTVVIPIGISVELPVGVCGQIWTRSGMAKKGIHVGAGLIDPDYRGEIGVVLHNLSKDPYVIEPGNRIAQMVLVPFVSASKPDAKLVVHDGFGSTGK